MLRGMLASTDTNNVISSNFVVVLAFAVLIISKLNGENVYERRSSQRGYGVLVEAMMWHCGGENEMKHSK